MLASFPYPHPLGAAGPQDGLIQPPDPRIGRVLYGLSRIATTPTSHSVGLATFVVAPLAAVLGVFAVIAVHFAITLSQDVLQPLTMAVPVLVAALAWWLFLMRPKKHDGDNLFLGEAAFEVVTKRGAHVESTVIPYADAVYLAHSFTEYTKHRSGTALRADVETLVLVRADGTTLFGLNTEAGRGVVTPRIAFARALLQAFARAQLPSLQRALEAGEERRIPLLRSDLGDRTPNPFFSASPRPGSFLELGPREAVLTLDGHVRLRCATRDLVCTLSDGKCVFSQRSQPDIRVALPLEVTPQAHLLAALFER